MEGTGNVIIVAYKGKYKQKMALYRFDKGSIAFERSFAILKLFFRQSISLSSRYFSIPRLLLIADTNKIKALVPWPSQP